MSVKVDSNAFHVAKLEVKLKISKKREICKKPHVYTLFLELWGGGENEIGGTLFWKFQFMILYSHFPHPSRVYGYGRKHISSIIVLLLFFF